jgi:ribosome-associated protein
MIIITENISINENELKFSFVHSSGPGGQNVNKVATAVQLKFNVNNSSLNKDIKERLIKRNKKKLSKDLTLTIDARKYRSQEKNKQDAIARLVKLIAHASEKPKKRKKTKPTQSANLKRLETKRKKSNLKKDRQAIKKQDY